MIQLTKKEREGKMKYFMKKLAIVLGIIISFVGISTSYGESVTSKNIALIKEDTPLYLEHVSNIHNDFLNSSTNSSNTLADADDDSHYSHYSHSSHSSHYSHYSGL